jgi:hypothetical protein
MMTLITTIVAPILLVPAFATGGSGRRRPDVIERGMPSESRLPGFAVEVPPGLCATFLDRLLRTAESAGWKPAYDRADEDTYLLRHGGDAAQIIVRDGRIVIDASDSRQPEFVRLVEQVRSDVMAEAGAVKVAPLT